MRILLCLLWLLIPWAASAQLAEAPRIPKLLVTATPTTAFTTNGYVQGQLVLRVQLLSRYPFEELAFTPPKFETADVVQLLRPRTRKISGYAGEGYAYETAIAVVPRQAGMFRIPAFTAVGAVSPAKDQELRFDLASTPIEIEVADAPATYDDDWWLAATRAEVDEAWSLPVENIRVGEVVQRKVSLRVWGVSAERLPVLTHPPAQGVAISLRSADTRTEISPEGLIAHADYVWDLEIDSQRIVFLKPIGLNYWNVIDHVQQSVTAPAHRLEPLPADSEASAAALMKEAADARDEVGMVALATAAGLAAPVLAFLAMVLFACIPTRADMLLRRTCKSTSNSEALYNAINHWLTASGLNRADMGQQMPARQGLSDHLFSRAHPAANVRSQLARQALAWSRRGRLSALWRRFRVSG